MATPPVICAVLGPLLALPLLGGCTGGPRPATEAPEPPLLPFVYQPGPDGATNGGVRSIMQDRDGRFWFGSHFEGVCRVDHGRVSRFTEADGLSDDQVRSIQQGPDGRIWFDTANGVSSFDGERVTTFTERRYPMLDDWSFRPDDLWFKAGPSHGFDAAERQPGVYRLEDGALTYHALPVPLQQRTNTGYSVTGFAKGKGGRVWIATYDAVFGFDGASFTVIDGARMGLRAGEGVPHVRCVFEDSKGRVWIGNNGVGVVMIDGDATTGLTPLRGTGEALLRMGAPLVASDEADAGRSLQRVFSIGEDRKGHIWIGTIGGGAWRYDGRSIRQFTAKDGLTTEDVMAIYQDREGELWVGGEGVFRLNGDRFDRVH